MSEILSTLDLIANLEAYRDLCDSYIVGGGSCSSSLIKNQIMHQQNKERSYKEICGYYILTDKRGHYANLLLTNFLPVIKELNSDVRVNNYVKVRIVKQLIDLVIKEETDKLLQVS